MDNATRRSLAGLRRTRSPQTRAERATKLLEQLGQQMGQLSRIREAAVLEMHDAGMSYGQIAAITNLSRSRIAQILTRRASRESGPRTQRCAAE